MLKPVLIPLGGTSESADILPVVSALTGAVGARVRLLRVVPEREPHRANAPDTRTEATDYTERVASALQNDAGLAVSSVVRQGDPATQIIDEILAAGVTGGYGDSRSKRAAADEAR